MASRSIFSLRVARCPACHARLPVRGNEPVVVCEYCDARVELVRRAPPTHGPASTPRRTVAQSHYSGFAWAIVLGATVCGIGAYLALIGALSFAEPSAQGVLEPTASSSQSGPTREAVVAQPAEGPTQSSRSPSSFPVSEQPPPRGSSSGQAPPEDPQKAKAPRPKPVQQPSGPVDTVAQAKQKLEPKVLACMRKTKTHALLAYMGNTSVGPVSLLRDSRTRVDGLRAKLAGTSLGRCIDEAGASVRTRAFKSNYVRFELRNDAAPDPLASLPAKADREAIGSTIESRDPKVHACAATHGQQGAHEVFYFAIDGPTGKVLSVRGSYGSKKFRRCAEAVYRTLVFDAVRQYEIKYTHHIQL